MMPPLASDDRAALKADIALRGVQVPVEYDEHGSVLDGHHRIELCGELGITNWPRIVRCGLSEEEKRQHARRLNLDRRHLSRDQIRALIAEDLRDRPGASDRTVAEGLGVDHKTVGTVRDRLEATGEIPQLEKREGRDGRARRIVQFVPSTPEEERGLALSAKALNERNRQAYREGARSLARDLSDRSALKPCGRKFPVIYADPPWRRKAGFGNRAYENHFPTMTWDAICALPVAQMALPDAWLFLWIPRAHAFAVTTMTVETAAGPVEVPATLAHRVARSWGFDQYSTCFVWTKTDEEHPEDRGNGLVVRDQDELLLLFKRGRGCPKPASNEIFGSNHRERSKPLGHSRKPKFYRHLITTMTGGLPVLELFARVDAKHPLPAGWCAWGNQAAPLVAESPAQDPKTGKVDCAAAPLAALAPSVEAEPVDDGLDLPGFLRRGHAECTVGAAS
jgi:N6-adenosine-specific RNA methylase IME4